MQLTKENQFYLGQSARMGDEATTGEPFFYDASDLTTHAVCLGMTGSGKTGLGIVLLEEAALNGLPALVIDPKGDMTNLLLTFPALSPDDFRPWVDAGIPRRQGISLDQYASDVARSWREGLACSGIEMERIARLKADSEFAIYTPGSDAGRQVSIVQSLQAPDLDWDEDAETLRETISSIVSALLALIGVESDPVTGREHILLSTLIENAWRTKSDIDLAQLIVQIQNPPFERLGVLPLEVFYPERERLSLTLALNGLLASPRFATWLSGDPLDVDGLLWAPDGRSRLSIFYLAHLSDSERLFFVTLLLERVRGWLRMQQGTPELRAILYLDELYGFMPPHPAHPPTKAPLLALLKQARAQGLGLVLCAQNPVDLDYKGLANAGSWFIGKLQTTNDRQRVLEGLGGASLEAGVPLDRQALDALIGGLEARTFLLHNVHASGPVRFKTRHTMSYLRGPLTRPQIRELIGSARRVAPTSAPPSAARSTRQAEPAAELTSVPQPDSPSPWDEFSSVPPILPSGIRQYFVPARTSLEWAIRGAEANGRMIIYRDKQLIYRPALIGRAKVRIDQTTHNIHQEIGVSRVFAVSSTGASVSWDAEPVAVALEELDERPVSSARFAAVPALLGDARRLNAAQKEFADRVYRETVTTLLYQPILKLVARPDEPESRFKRRCYAAVEKERDAELRRLEKRYESKINRLQASIRREERELEQDQTEYEARKREELLSAGESVFNLLTRRRHSRMLSIASQKRRMTEQSKAEIQESEEAIQDLEQQVDAVLQDLEREKAEIQDRWSEAADRLETIQLRPRKSDVLVETWGVVWLPYWDVLLDEAGQQEHLRLPAFEPERRPEQDSSSDSTEL